jgi:hypothetical protein
LQFECIFSAIYQRGTGEGPLTEPNIFEAVGVRNNGPIELGCLEMDRKTDITLQCSVPILDNEKRVVSVIPESLGSSERAGFKCTMP